VTKHLVKCVVGVRQLDLGRVAVDVPAQIERQLFHLAGERRESRHLPLRQEAPLVVQGPRTPELGVHAPEFGAATPMPLENCFGE
jgi:hypothetical protein